jgi:hypothetical protein
MGTGYRLSFLTKYNCYCRDYGAKARSIGIINRPGVTILKVTTSANTIESFIQTDAAINPEIVAVHLNTNGELIGINSAIASQTGSYAGYAFAIPVNLAKKILDDLKQYGCKSRSIRVAFPSPSDEERYFKQRESPLVQ